MHGDTKGTRELTVAVQEGPLTLAGSLGIPEGARGIVVFAHGSGSSRLSPRNRGVAAALREAGMGTLLMDLLTSEEEEIDARTAHLRFDISLLAGRLEAATEWLGRQPRASGLPVGYFGASTGAAAALAAAAALPDAVRAVVSRGGRPDLAQDALSKVKAPTLLIIGGRDVTVLALNRQAMERITAVKELAVVPGATHLFEEPGALEEVARLSADWFARHLR